MLLLLALWARCPRPRPVSETGKFPLPYAQEGSLLELVMLNLEI